MPHASAAGVLNFKHYGSGRFGGNTTTTNCRAAGALLDGRNTRPQAMRYVASFPIVGQRPTRVKLAVGGCCCFSIARSKGTAELAVGYLSTRYCLLFFVRSC